MEGHVVSPKGGVAFSFLFSRSGFFHLGGCVGKDANLYQLKKREWLLAKHCYLHKSSEESTNYILLYCLRLRGLCHFFCFRFRSFLHL